MKNIVYIIIIAFLGLFILKSECGKPKEPGQEIKIDGKKYEIVKSDTIVKEHTTIKYKKGEDVFHDTTIYVEIPKDVVIDTQAILKDYYAKNAYIDTFKTDLGPIVVKDTIQKNKIAGRTYEAYLKTKEVVTYVKDKPKAQLYLGFRGDFLANYKFNGVGPQVMLKTKKNKIYGVGVMLTGDKPVYSANFAFKL
jgi:hypothetical protein